MKNWPCSEWELFLFMIYFSLQYCLKIWENALEMTSNHERVISLLRNQKERAFYYYCICHEKKSTRLASTATRDDASYVFWKVIFFTQHRVLSCLAHYLVRRFIYSLFTFTSLCSLCIVFVDFRNLYSIVDFDILYQFLLHYTYACNLSSNCKHIVLLIIYHLSCSV